MTQDLADPYHELTGRESSSEADPSVLVGTLEDVPYDECERIASALGAFPRNRLNGGDLRRLLASYGVFVPPSDDEPWIYIDGESRPVDHHLRGEEYVRRY